MPFRRSGLGHKTDQRTGNHSPNISVVCVQRPGVVGKRNERRTIQFDAVFRRLPSSLFPKSSGIYRQVNDVSNRAFALRTVSRVQHRDIYLALHAIPGNRAGVPD